MLGVKYKLDITINDIDRELYFNYQFLKNLYVLTNCNPLYYIQELSKENMDDYLATILYCMSNGSISLDYIDDILQDDEVKSHLLLEFIRISRTELTSEYEEVNDDNENKEVSEEDKLKQFEQYWNYCYYTATTQLHKTEKEFLAMTPRELKTLSMYDSNYFKNILLSAYIDVIKSKNGNSESGYSEEEEVVTVNRVRDLFK